MMCNYTLAPKHSLVIALWIADKAEQPLSSSGK